MRVEDQRPGQIAHWTDFLANRYRIHASLERLVGDRDLNFRAASDQRDVILKVMHIGCEQPLVDAQCQALAEIAAQAPHLPVPRVIPNSTGELSTTFSDENGAERIAWVISVLPGVPYAGFRPQRLALIRSLGAMIADIDEAIARFDHPLLDRVLSWDLRQAGWVAGEIDVIPDEGRRRLIARIMKNFYRLEAALGQQPMRAVHNDINDYNVLVQASPHGEAAISGIIDFGDIIRAPVVCELAIAGAYAVLDQDHPLRALGVLVAGYHGVAPLTGEQIDLLWPLLLTRLAVSVVNSTISHQERPDEPYQLISQAPAWRFLERAADWDHGLVAAQIRAACDLPVADGAEEVTAFLNSSAGNFGAVLHRDLSTATRLDLSVRQSRMPRNPLEPTADEALALAVAGSIGGYGEPRLINNGSAVGGNRSGEPVRRTVHLGLDIFAGAGQSIHAPLDGTVHAAGLPLPGDESGGMVVLAHTLASGQRFYTSYRHLNPVSTAALGPGRNVAAGEVFATLGDHAVNGGWAPHLHVQIFLIETTAAGWPASVDPDERHWWQAMCPDPLPLLNLDGDTYSYQPLDGAGILAARRDRYASNLKLSYDTPCLFVRGWRHHLFDEWGRAFLDAYNNVPHVGHANPRIAAVAADQLARMNSNTRYLHPAQIEIAELLLAKMPDHLGVCFFVNSGSEANELALRLARAHTSGTDMIALKSGYHGHTTGAIDMSSYKFDHPNGGGAPDWVQIVPIADTYRGLHRGPDAAKRYADEIDRAITRIRERHGRLAGFIAETFPSVGGQIVPPPGYLRAVYDKVRAAGGVTIADEIQTGLGRLGSHYWGFEAQGAAPDIVVLGKPLGNGHPMGAVVATRAIAASFDSGVEFFSTFGGSTLSCRTGAEVIRIIDEEGLQANALAVGNHLIGGLNELRQRHDIIGEVRGQGLFVGVDLVTDSASRAPAGDKATYVANRLRDLQVLIGTEAPRDNVLKIRPPLTFGMADADIVLEKLDKVLGETTLF